MPGSLVVVGVMCYWNTLFELKRLILVLAALHNMTWGTSYTASEVVPPFVPRGMMKREGALDGSLCGGGDNAHM